MELWRKIPKKIVFGIVLAGLTIFSIVFELKYANRFYPGVIIGQEHVGGKSYEEVLEHFKERAESLHQNGIRIIFENAKASRRVPIPPSVTGLTSDQLVEYFSLGDWEQTISTAYQWGRTGSAFRRIKEQASLIGTSKHFNFPGIPYTEAIQSLLQRELKNFFSKTVPAQFLRKTGVLEISQEKIGERVNPEDVLDAIRQKLLSLDPSPLSFKAAPDLPAATAENLKPFLKFANELSRSTGLIFSYKTSAWYVRGPLLATWLTIKKDGDIGINTVEMEAFLSKNVAPLIDDPPQNSRFEIRNDKLVEIVPGKRGNVVDIKKTAERVEHIVTNIQKHFSRSDNLLLAFAASGVDMPGKPYRGDVIIPIELTQAEPGITKQTIDRYEIKDLVGFARSSFTGSSEDRRHNIEVGVSKLTGILLAPGEEFSTLRAIGTTTEEMGFVKEFVIKEDKTIPELGGGLCQVATTLFRLALSAGLPITERVNHRYVVGYYGAGLDATIYSPNPDLKFINDTGNYLLMQGRVENDDVVFEFYGQQDGRLVEISEPKLYDEISAPPIKYTLSPDIPLGQVTCSETPRKGMTADVLYSVRHPNGETKEQTFHSIYQPWQKVCLIGYKR